MTRYVIACVAGGLFLAGCASPGEDQVAVVNGTEIPAGEFKSRLESYIRTTGVRDNILLRKQIVTNMIHEVLILEEAKRQGWDSDNTGRKRIEEIRSQALLDAYANHLIREVAVTEEDLHEEFRKRNMRVSARYVYGSTEKEAQSLKMRLEKGETFGKLAAEVFDDPGLATNGGYVGYFGPGEMGEEFEAAAFRLSVGSISEPVRIGAGYAVLRVEDRKILPLQSEHDYARVKHELADEVLQRKSREALELKAREVGGEGNPRFDDELLGELFDFWKTPGKTDPEEQSAALRNGDAKVVIFDGGSLTGNEILRGLLSTSDKQRKRIQTPDDFRKAVLGLVARESLIGLARKAGLEKQAEVVAQIADVTKSYLLTRWKKNIEDSVDQQTPDVDELQALFEEHRDSFVTPPEVRTREILVRDKKTAGEVLSKLRSGGDFSALAKKFSIRRWAANQGGDLGFGTRSTFGALADKLFAAKSGEVIGPERVDPYFGIFKVTEKREGRRLSFDEARNQLETEVKTLKKREALEKSLEDLRLSATYTIHDAVVERIVVDGMNTRKEIVQ